MFLRRIVPLTMGLHDSAKSPANANHGPVEQALSHMLFHACQTLLYSFM